ncbi:TolC family protein [Zobellella iuensis]|uniref:TolC family protein n=1 Tax=Zobellella iuensis TaxID=2803811 RepID=A0ABS1QWF9_9GAMM|nr:TolC family protein [Zobellella iuensis]
MISVSYAAPMPFDAAWRQLRAQHQGLAAEQANVSKAEAQQRAARALFLPQLDASATYLHLDRKMELKGSDLNLNQVHTGNAGLDAVIQEVAAGIAGLTLPLVDQNLVRGSVTALWPLFTGGRITAAQDIRAAQLDEAREQLRLKEQALFETLAERYFTVVLARELLDTRERSRDSLARHHEHALKLEQQGQVARIERLSAEAAYHNARVEADNARRNLELAELAFRELVASPVATPANPLFIGPELEGLEGFIERMEASHPALKVLAAKLEQADGAIRAEQGRYYPEVFAFGNYSLHERDSITSQISPDWVVGLGAKVALVDRNGRGGLVAAARSAELQVRHLGAQTRQDLRLLVEKTWRQARQAREQFEALASTLALAEENLRLRQHAFTQGLSTSLEVTDAELRLSGARTQRQAAAYQYVVSLARLLAVSGQPDTFTQYQQQAAVQGNR